MADQQKPDRLIKAYVVEGESHDFTDLKPFREAHHLPSDFGVATFEPKDYTNLARIDTAGGDLNDLREAVLASVPSAVILGDLFTVTNALTDRFRDELTRINPRVNLKQVELDFAVAGFGDVCQAFLYDRLRARSGNDTPQPFITVYRHWLDDTVRVSQRVHEYTHQGATWHVQIINTAYGRLGMRIRMGDDDAVYVRDASLACPAEGFMLTLLTDVAARLDTALGA